VLYSINAELEEVEVGRTEVIRDDLNPNWTKQFVLDYYFEEIQRFKVRVYDEDKLNEENLSSHDFIGQCWFDLSQVVKSNGMALLCPLMKGDRDRGQLIIHGEEMDQSKEFLRMQVSGRDLANKDGLFDKSDPYLTALRCKEDGTWSRVWKSDIIMDNLNPDWNEAVLNVQQLCNGDKDRPIKFEIWDFDRYNDHDYMGEFTLTVNEILASGGGDGIPVMEVKKGKSKQRGSAMVNYSEIMRVPTMMDFLAGGCEVSLMVAVDFTGSNGEPSNPASLHYIDPSGDAQNDYQRAIDRVGRVLEQYDTDKKFPIFGFGGKFGGKLSHCFPLFGEGEEVEGADGLLITYEGAMNEVSLSGPTLMNQVLAEAKRRAAEDKNSGEQKYSVLLVLCDGQFQDIDQSINKLVEADDLPLSVVIVGIGNEDFAGEKEIVVYKEDL